METNDDFYGKEVNLNCFYMHINFEQKYPKMAIVIPKMDIKMFHHSEIKTHLILVDPLKYCKKHFKIYYILIIDLRFVLYSKNVLSKVKCHIEVKITVVFL